MSGIRSRSTAAKNTVPFRHIAFFLDDEGQYIEGFNPDAPLDQFAGTDRDSLWLFRRHKVNGDAEDIQLLIASGSIDWNALADDYAKNGAAQPTITADMRTSYQRAELCQMTASVSGPFFTIPAEFTVGDEKLTADDTAHPLAGHVMPMEPAWLNHIDEPVLDAATAFIKELYAGRSASEQASFPASPAPVPAPAGPAQRRGTRGKK